jgi:serine/threonine-protein kinase
MMNAVMPWDWLTKVEIRQRSFSIFPNYVYFQFKDRSNVLILWEDVRADMDSTTLISCVRTWAPQAEIRGDANMTRAESIATYTELWLKDLNLTTSDRRLRQDQMLPEGTVISDRYKIERILSGGGQGTAYLASVLAQTELANLPPQVVIKEFILPANNRGMQKAKDSLLKEVAILRRIDHPKIIRLYDFFLEDMRGYFAIEYVDGLTLRQLIEQSGPMAEAAVAKIGVSLCEALTYLHELTPPVIHGDVTPDNVMIENTGSIKLLDFDAAQELTRNKTNTVVGKHAYMSPEQFKGMLGEGSDIYALGCTLHFLLTATDPEPITESCPRNISNTVSTTMNEIVLRATRLDQSARFSDLKEMRTQLERL